MVLGKAVLAYVHCEPVQVLEVRNRRGGLAAHARADHPLGEEAMKKKPEMTMVMNSPRYYKPAANCEPKPEPPKCPGCWRCRPDLRAARNAYLAGDAKVRARQELPAVRPLLGPGAGSPFDRS